MNYRIAPIPQDYLDRVRTHGIDDLNQPVRRIVSANGGEPCRDALRCAQPGEEIILASFSPFTAVGPYHEYGPVFVFANSQEDNMARDRLPLPRGNTSAYLSSQFVLRAYDAHEDIIDAVIVKAEEAEAQVVKYLSNTNVTFVHARFPDRGCFAMRIDRI